MTNVLQPSDNDRATLYSIAWDIVKRHLDVSDQRLSAQDIAGMVAQVAARIAVDGGCANTAGAGSKSPG